MNDVFPVEHARCHQGEIITESKELARVQGESAKRRGFMEGKNYTEDQFAKEDGRATVQEAMKTIETLTREKEKLERELAVARRQAAPQLKQQELTPPESARSAARQSECA
eukprot:COSAG01_NODE_36518_length_516_cov_2.122302_1_plen_110_part_10